METSRETLQIPLKRIWELDAWRGLIVFLMMIYHFVLSLYMFYGIAFNPVALPLYPTLWVSLTFYPVAGISSGLSRSPVRNGLRCLAAAAAVTLVTWYLMPQSFISFGTLHLLALAMLLTPLWQRLPDRALFGAAATIVALGLGFSRIRVANPWLFPLGLLQLDYNSLDYFPIFPYLAPYLIGVWLHRRYYLPRLSLFPELAWTRPFQFLGRHALAFYLLHQPLFLGVAAIFLGFPEF